MASKLQKIDEHNESSTSNIGEEVRTVSGHNGILICSNEMGITPMDLFNDIMTNPADLQSFLGADNCKETDNIALRNT